MTRTNGRYGWIPDLPDHRDLAFAPSPIITALPPKVDLRDLCPPVYDQGQLGSCTANAIAGAVEFDQMKQAETPFVPSRLFIYFNERTIEGTVASDAGAMIRDGVKSVATTGYCPEADWPYDITQFAAEPPERSFADAKTHKVGSYLRVARDLDHMKSCLADGFPFVLGFSVYASFESADVASSGIVPMPASGESLLGGHAVLAVGYDDATGRFVVRNSWGPSWGQQGYFELPYEFLTRTDLSSDFWTIRTAA